MTTGGRGSPGSEEGAVVGTGGEGEDSAGRQRTMDGGQWVTDGGLAVLDSDW